jgi:hypothetical protein
MLGDCFSHSVPSSKKVRFSRAYRACRFVSGPTLVWGRLTATLRVATGGLGRGERDLMVALPVCGRACTT